MPPDRSQTNNEIVPGAFPCNSSCCGEVTIASATFGVVSDTRVIGSPTEITVDRPTSSWTSLVSDGVGAEAVGSLLRATTPCNDCACGAAMVMATNSATARNGLCGRGAPDADLGLMGILLTHDFFGPLVTADDFDRGRPIDRRRREQNGSGPRDARPPGHGELGDRGLAEQARRPDAGRARRPLVERI